MSYIKIYETLNSQFAKITEVANSIKSKEGNYVNTLKQWFLSTEQLLKSYNIEESIEIAGFRGQLMITEFAMHKEDDTKDNTKSSALLELVEPIKDTMINAISPLELRIRDCESIIKELLAEQLELNLYSWNNGLNYRDFIQAVWRTLLKQENTKERAKKVKELIGEDDVLKLISDQIKIS